MAARNDLVAIPRLNNYSAEYPGDSYGLAQYLGDISGKTGIAAAIASLRARGSDAHLWLPGVGTVSGLTTGNYLESTGNSIATVDNPTGLVLDAMGTVGSELAPPIVVGGTWAESDGASTFVTVANGSISIVTDGLSAGGAGFQIVGGAGKIYRVSLTTTGTGQLKIVYGGNETVFTDSLSAHVVFGASGTAFNIYRVPNQAANRVITSISVREVTGIHLTQSTTANKGLLKQDAGSRYYWLFDATDLLTGTFPAGYESVTVIDAKSTGQVTTSAANVVGSYSIGPSYSSYGRIIIKGSITASELALYQGFANKLAGL